MVSNTTIPSHIADKTPQSLSTCYCIFNSILRQCAKNKKNSWKLSFSVFVKFALAQMNADITMAYSLHYRCTIYKRNEILRQIILITIISVHIVFVRNRQRYIFYGLGINVLFAIMVLTTTTANGVKDEYLYSLMHFQTEMENIIQLCKSWKIGLDK